MGSRTDQQDHPNRVPALHREPARAARGLLPDQAGVFTDSHTHLREARCPPFASCLRTQQQLPSHGVGRALGHGEAPSAGWTGSAPAVPPGAPRRRLRRVARPGRDTLRDGGEGRVRILENVRPTAHGDGGADAWRRYPARNTPFQHRTSSRPADRRPGPETDPDRCDAPRARPELGALWSTSPLTLEHKEHLGDILAG